jgi:hypothetical protein
MIMSEEAMHEGWHTELMKVLRDKLEILGNSENFYDSFQAIDDLSGIIHQASVEAEDNADYFQKLKKTYF